jgi:predicted nucleic acid-binding protein
VKRLFLDVNVILDWLLWRVPFAKAAQTLWAAAETGQIEAFVPAQGVTTVFYIVERERDTRSAHQVVASVLEVAQVAAVDAAVLKRALALQWKDYEDAVCAAAAEAARCELLVTRDPRGFRESPISAADPATAVRILGLTSDPDSVAERPARYRGSRKPRSRKRGRPPAIPA